MLTPMATPFVHSVRVRPLDCDRQGIVGHPRYLHFFEAALMEMWREVLGPFGETGIDLTVAEVNVRYFAPTRFDDVLDIAVILRELDTSSAVVRFDVRVQGGLAVRGDTHYVSTGTASGAREPIPEPVRRALTEYMES
jgi:acyl-CoA thioester hydrolase